MRIGEVAHWAGPARNDLQGLSFVTHQQDLVVSPKSHSDAQVGGTRNSLSMQLFLMPWKRVKRGKTPPVYPLRLGPLAQRWDTGLAAVVESYTLHQWNSDLSTVASASWQDVANSTEDIHGVSQSQHGSFLGTDSGLVAIVKPDGRQELMESAHTESGSFDSCDGVLASAVADEVGLAVVGTLKGQIKVYDTSVRNGAPQFITDANERDFAIYISRNSPLIASASGNGDLHIWRVGDERLNRCLK